MIFFRALFIQNNKNTPPFSVTSPFYSNQLKKDLVHNVLKGAIWGTYRHLHLETHSDSSLLTVEHAYINTLVRGDLSSLKWIEGPLTYYRYVCLVF